MNYLFAPFRRDLLEMHSGRIEGNNVADSVLDAFDEERPLHDSSGEDQAILVAYLQEVRVADIEPPVRLHEYTPGRDVDDVHRGCAMNLTLYVEVLNPQSLVFSSLVHVVFAQAIISPTQIGDLTNGR